MYKDRFPEDLYQPIDRSRFNHDVQRGYDIASDNTIAVVGLAYNCEDVILRNISRAMELGSFFKESRVFIVENGSTDNTSSLVSGFGKSLSMTRPKFDPIDSVRFHYMAKIRNEYMAWLKKVCPDYVLVYDFDIKGGFSYDGIMHSLAQRKQAVGSNGLIYTPERKFYDYISLIYSDKRKGNGDVHYQRGEPLLRVESVFGGACLYKYSYISELHYSGRFDGCEHTSVNNRLECFLNPSQIVLYSDNYYTE